ncbi:MAG: DUF4255 domain-containing protein, partial [Myxococcales bacterium]|nr:DUF4255 domain-containing protein [Myxococcales bacterium]
MPGPPQATPLIIRHVTSALIEVLRAALPGVTNIEAAPPEVVSQSSAQILGLYLYRVVESAELKNQGPTFEPVAALPPGAPATLVRTDPLCLNLHYLLMPFSPDESYLDTYDLLGRAMLALHENAILIPGALGVAVDPSEVELEFRVTMEPLTTTELAAIWEAVHEPYRLSVSYVVRTVQIRAGDTTDARRVTT